jgi:hypothetical protein
VRPEVPTAQSSPPNKPVAAAGKRRKVPWFRLSFLLIAVAVIGLAIYHGQDVKHVGLNGEIDFYSRDGQAGPDQQEVTRRQQGIEQRLRDLEASPQREGSGTTAGLVDLTGSWQGDNGFTYLIEQYGSEAVIEETSIYGVTAVGRGEVDGTQFDFMYEAYDGSQGSGTLVLDASGVLSGTFNLSYGGAAHLRLAR